MPQQPPYPLPRALTALLDTSHALYWQCCMDTVQLVVHHVKHKVRVVAVRGCCSGEVTFLLNGGVITVDDAGTSGERLVASCVLRHVQAREHCFCAPPLSPELVSRFGAAPQKLQLTPDLVDRCREYLASPYTGDHLWMMQMLMYHAHRPEQEDMIAALLTQCVHPLETRCAHLLTMASLLFSTLRHLSAPWYLLKQLVQKWARVAQSYVCPRCTLKGVSAVPSHVLTRKRLVHGETHMAMVSVTCVHCYRAAVVCISTPAKIGPTSEWWRESKWKWRTTSWTPPPPAAGGTAGQKPVRAAVHSGCALAETPSQTPLLLRA